MTLEPIRLAANQPPQFYRGGDAIAALRGAPAEAEFGPEDWVASATDDLELIPNVHNNVFQKAFDTLNEAYAGRS